MTTGMKGLSSRITAACAIIAALIVLAVELITAIGPEFGISLLIVVLMCIRICPPIWDFLTAWFE